VNTSEEIKKLVDPVLETLGLELVDVEVKGGGGKSIVRITIDVAGGIRIGQCTQASRVIADLLDQKDVIPGRYTLEVSSPGTDRPLKSGKDFSRHCHRMVKVNFTVNGETSQCLGQINRVEDDMLYLHTADSDLKIPLCDITLAKIVVEMK